MKTTRLFLILAFSCAASVSYAQSVGVAHADLQAEAQVDGRVITLGDVAKLSGANQDTLDSLRHVQLAITPQPGYSAHLTQREVLHLMHEAGSQNVVLDGAEATTITAIATPIDPEPLVAAAKESLAAALSHYGQVVELIQTKTLPEIRLPRGEVTFRARPQLIEKPQSHMIVSVDILLDGRFYRTAPVSFSVTAMRNVLVAHSDLIKGQTLSCANVDHEQRDIAQLPAAPQADDCAKLNRRLRRNLSAGQVVLSEELEAIPAVSEGDFITLEVTEGAVVLESRAQALTDGNIGQRIAVRATTSQEPVLGMVVAPGVVNVSGR